jgi:DNA-binding NtrC family response regulator
MNSKLDTAPFCVLLVDDDHDVLGANARYLRIEGFEVVVANSAAVAFERLQEHTIDAVITDLIMPTTPGLAFAQKLRFSHPLLPIVFFSGHASVPDVVNAMRLGAVDFLEKPIDPEVLLKTLTDLRDRYERAAVVERTAFVPDEISAGTVSFRTRVLAYEKFIIEASLEEHEGSVAKVIDALKINRRTLNEKMVRLGIRRSGEST